MKQEDNVYVNRIGETSTHKGTGLTMTIIGYTDSQNVDIQFSDGVIVKGKSYQAFKKGIIGHKCATHVGERVRANNGLEMTLIEYRSSRDVDVQFEDGTVVKNRTYSSFKSGHISCEGVDSYHNGSKTRIGEEITASNGMKMTIIDYRNAHDLDVQFEDGTIVTNKEYKRFRTGGIKHPTIRMKRVDTTKHVGETMENIHGEKMTVIEYTGNKTVTVKFEDGTIRENVSYKSFSKGVLTAMKFKEMQDKKQNRLGMKKVARNGMKMTVIEYHSSSNITVQFEDGTIVENVRWQAFEKGYVKNNNIKKKLDNN